MALWSEQIVLPEKKTVSTKQDELLLSNRGEWLGVATIGISRVGSHTQEEEVKLGGEFRYGPYTFGLFEVRLMEIGEDDDTVTVLVTRLS